MTALLEARSVSRSFGHVRALDRADFDISPGEVVGLIGDNGAGKSTLIKALSGSLELDEGEIYFEGRPVRLSSPRQANDLGIEVVYQDLALAPHLNPVQNVFLGREIPRKGVLGRLGFMDKKEMRRQAAASFKQLGATVRSLNSPVGSMSGGQRQGIAIARAIAWADKVVILDEPTAALGVIQTKNVLESVKRVRDKGIAVVLISHSMPHVLEVCDRIQVLRLGRRVATYPGHGTTVETLVGAMTGALDVKEGAASMSRSGGVAMSRANQPAVAAGDADEFGGTQSLLKRVVGLQAFWILGVLIVICLFFTVIAGDRFLSTGNFSLISQNVAVWAVIGVGMTFVIITSGIDLSVGSVLVFSSVVAAKLMEAMGGNGVGVAAMGLVAAILSGMVWGVVNGVLVAMAKVPPLIVTLGTLSVALGLAQVITGGIDIRSVPTELTDFSAYTKILGIPGLPFVALVVLVLGGILLHKTRFGRYTYAIGSNEEAARRTGVKVTRHLVLVYALAGTLAGLGALLSLAQYGTTTIAGQSLTNLNVIAAVVIGGTSIFGGFGTIFGTVVGLFIPAVLQSGFVIIGVQPFWQGVAVGSVLIAAVYVDQTRRAAAMRSARSRGLFKRRGSK